jgi:hypothetical protein
VRSAVLRTDPVVSARTASWRHCWTVIPSPAFARQRRPRSRLTALRRDKPLAVGVIGSGFEAKNPRGVRSLRSASSRASRSTARIRTAGHASSGNLRTWRGDRGCH